MPYLLMYLLTIYFGFFNSQYTKAEGHNELWNVFLFSLRKAKYVVLLNTTLLFDIFFTLKVGSQENALFIEVILVYPGNYGVTYIYMLMYIYTYIWL